MSTENTFIRRFQLWRRDTKANGILICWPITVGPSRGMLHRRNIRENRHFLLSRWVRIFEYCVVVNVENIKCLKLQMPFSRKPCVMGKNRFHIWIQEKKFYQNHIHFFLRQKKFFVPPCFRPGLCHRKQIQLLRKGIPQGGGGTFDFVVRIALLRYG